MPRVAGVPVTVDKWEALTRLEPAHREAVEELGFAWSALCLAEQVHGDGLAVVGHDGYVVSEASASNPASGQLSIHISVYVSAVQCAGPMSEVRDICRIHSFEHRDHAENKADQPSVL